MTSQFEILHGDCLEVMRSMADNSIDSIVTDPPYGLTANKKGGTGNGVGGFMGMKWDSDVPNVEIWAECLRILKPGGYLLAFAGTRTQHRMCTRIEDAGFEIRDMIAWIYGSGFPKSLDVSKAVEATIKTGHSDSANQWKGWGTALKPAMEPITVARKPLIGTVAKNVIAYGTGALNIDGCRVETNDSLGGGAQKTVAIDGKGEGWQRPWMHDAEAVAAHAARVNEHVERAESLGRWPANIIHDGSDEVVSIFPGGETQQDNALFDHITDDNTASSARFFYCAKTSKKDKNAGLKDGKTNNHPTTKPTALMQYLCRLVTPPKGIVLDPFVGSGSTGKAAVLEGFSFIGIEREAEYFELAKERVAAASVPDIAENSTDDSIYNI